MRNRGIEIFMFNEKDGINEFDLKAMLELKGLRNKSLINALIDVHDFVVAHTLGGYCTRFC